MSLSVLPAFNGGGATLSAYGLIPDPDGHSIWAVMCSGGFPEDSYTETIVKIDLNTQQRTATFAFPNGRSSDVSPDVIHNATPIMFLDASGKIWAAGFTPGTGTQMFQYDPASAFAQVQVIGQSGDKSVADLMPFSLVATFPYSFIYFEQGGVEYCALSGGDAGFPYVVVFNLTTGTTVGNWWLTDQHGNYPDGTLTGITAVWPQFFMDGAGNLWWAMIISNDAGNSDVLFFKWNPSDGTTTQPTNFWSYADPFLNGVTYTRVPWENFSSTGNWFSDAGQVRVQYVPTLDYVLIGTAQNGTGTGAGGDIALLKLSDFSQVAYIPTADPAATFYWPNNGEDAGMFTGFNSKRLGYAQTNLAFPGGGAVNAGKFGNLLQVASPADLASVTTFDLATLVRAADPLAVAGYTWAGLWNNPGSVPSSYEINDIVGVGTPADFNLYIALAPMAKNAFNPSIDGGVHWQPIAANDPIPSSSLTYRGTWDSITTYNANDVVVRLEFIGQRGCQASRPSTATATSTGADPYISGSDTWWPASDCLWNPPGWTSRATLPWANVLYYQTNNWVVFTFDFVGSPVYFLSVVSFGNIIVNKVVAL